MQTVASPLERSRPWRRAAAGAVAALAFVPLMASAQYIMEFAQTYAAPTSNFISNTFLNQEALINATQEGPISLIGCPIFAL